MIEILSVGPIGSVGDVLPQERLKTSAPDMPIRNRFSDARLVASGSTAGTLPKTIWNSAYKGKQTWKDANKIKEQQIMPEEKRYEPVNSFSFSNFDNLRAQVLGNHESNKIFRTLPMGYTAKPGQLNRGGNAPRITDIAGGDFHGLNNVVGTTPIQADLAKPPKLASGRMSISK